MLKIVGLGHTLIVNIRVVFIAVKDRSGFHKKAVRYSSLHASRCIKPIRHPERLYNTQWEISEGGCKWDHRLLNVPEAGCAMYKLVVPPAS